MENEKIGNLEAISFFVVLSINAILLSISQFLINQCGSSSLLNVLYVTFIGILVMFIFCLLLKKFEGQSLLNISQFLGGKVLKIIVGICFIAYFICRSCIFLRKISICLQIVYYPMTNIIFITSLFCIAAGVIVGLKNNSILKSCTLIFPILFLIIILIFIGNAKNFTFENIYPILGNGINETFFSGITNIFAFGGISYIFFLPPKLKHPEKFTKISILSMIFCGIFLIFTIANILFLFNIDVETNAIFPLYISVRYIEFGTFFQRLDSVFLLLCILTFICTLSLNVYIIIDIFKEISNISDSKPIIFPCLLTIFGFSIAITQNSALEFLENTISKVLFITLSLVVTFIILVSANIKKKIIGGKT